MLDPFVMHQMKPKYVIASWAFKLHDMPLTCFLLTKQPDTTKEGEHERDGAKNGTQDMVRGV